MYLNDIPLAQAKNIFHDLLIEIGSAGIIGVEEISLDEKACGRVLAEPVLALQCSPAFHSAAMDGFAVKAEDTNKALPSSPGLLTVPGQAIYVDTGDLLPVWANAVIPIEKVESLDASGRICSDLDLRHPAVIRIRGAVSPWSHVRLMGEDIITSQLILASGQKLRPVDLGAAAAGGATTLRVVKKPLVGIIPTGSELVAIGKTPEKGQLIEFNSVVLAAQVGEWGGIPKRYEIVSDDFEAIKRALQITADECDLVLINAGSSAGSEDFTAQAVEQLGSMKVHGVAVRPGHPVILGSLKCSKTRKDGRSRVPVIGVPGYPVSAALTGEIFIEPLIHEWLGLPGSQMHSEIEATLTRTVVSPAGDDDYLRVVVGEVEGRLLAAPLARSAGMTTSLSKADGVVVIPASVQGFSAGEKVKVKLYRHVEDLQATVFCIGSHDLTLDLLAQYLSPFGRKLISSNVGSLGGIMALKRHEAHFAGSHLLDEESGEYNIPFIQKYLPDDPVHLIGWVERIQGLMVQRGNPKGISGIRDLMRQDVRFINRQRGSGTRNLLEYWLKKEGIKQTEITGFKQEENTHLGVAVAVASNRADCGLAIEAATIPLGLDFIPLFEESYQLIIPKSLIDKPLMQPLFDLMEDPEFVKAITKIPGYKVTNLGSTMAIINGK